MPVVVIGIDHRTAPNDLLAQLAINADELNGVLEVLQKSDHITEAVVLSTCMRTEIYVEAVRFHGAVHDARDVLCRLAGGGRERLTDSLFELYDETAFADLFRVASGLESTVLGEPEVLGQVARAWAVALESGSAKAILNSLFRRAVEVGKRARTETAISRGTTSIGHAAVEMAQDRIGSLAAKRVLLVGAGEMADSMAVAIAHPKHAASVAVTNRTYARAVELAGRVNAAVVDFSVLGDALSDVDVVLTCTGSSEPVISVAMVRQALDSRGGRPIVFVDVAMPADVEPEVADLDGVTVLGMTDLRAFTEKSKAGREHEVAVVEDIIEAEVWRYVADASARTVVPVLAALRERVESIRQNELQRHGNRLNALDPESAALVESMSASIVAKLLHDPTVRLKEAAGRPEGERMAEAIRFLFDI